jgi:hypothetical protein
MEMELSYCCAIMEMDPERCLKIFQEKIKNMD